MKLPKLKYYYYAMNERDYDQFQTDRTLAVSPIAIDILTGAMSGRPYLTLCTTPGLADDMVRQHYQHRGTVYVLRIPRAAVEQRHLRLHEPDVFHYASTLTVPHCGVYRYDLDKSSAETYNKTIAAASIMQLPKEPGPVDAITGS